jgi:hypothetical protein
METVVRGLTYKSYLAYLEMINIGCTFWAHLQNLEKVFQRFQGAHGSFSKKYGTCVTLCARRNNYGPQETEGCMEVANPKEKAWNKELPGPMYLLQVVCLWLR